MNSSAVVLLSLCLLAGNAAAKESLPEGYLLVQIVSTYQKSDFGAISSSDEGRKIFNAAQGRIDAFEYETLFYDENSMEVHRTLAQLGVDAGFDLWATSWGLVRKISLGSFGALDPDFQASFMKPDGTIVPAIVEGVPLFDVVNNDAVAWFLKVFRNRYLVPMKGLVAGFFFNEDVLPYMGAWSNNTRYDYWNTAVYSRAILRQWVSYCKNHNVTYRGKVVDKFPVHRQEMVKKGEGKTEYYPGYDVPERIRAGQKFVDMPKVQGVWKHWYDFLSEQFVDGWIGRIAREANDVNRNSDRWYGTAYFGLHHWSLPYEEVVDPAFTVPFRHTWGAWGRQRGLDLAMLSRNPDMDIIICETYPPVSANIEFFIREFKRIALAGGKKFGLMLHRDDRWPLKEQEELERWMLIKKYRPTMLVRYPVGTMLPWGRYYDDGSERLFFERLQNYRQAR